MQVRIETVKRPDINHLRRLRAGEMDEAVQLRFDALRVAVETLGEDEEDVTPG